MKQTAFCCLFFLLTTIVGNSQQLHTIPGLNLSQVPDGWHKFMVENVIFDVEVKEERLLKGVIQWLDGSSYSGDLFYNSISGIGTYKWPNGMSYEGALKKSKRHGRGSFILQNGSKWNGKWKKNRKNGKGKIYDNTGKIIKKGVWKEDVFQEESKKART